MALVVSPVELDSDVSIDLARHLMSDTHKQVRDILQIAHRDR